MYTLYLACWYSQSQESVRIKKKIESFRYIVPAYVQNCVYIKYKQNVKIVELWKYNTYKWLKKKSETDLYPVNSCQFDIPFL